MCGGGEKLNRYLNQHWVLSGEVGKWNFKIKIRGKRLGSGLGVVSITCKDMWNYNKSALLQTAQAGESRASTG